MKTDPRLLFRAAFLACAGAALPALAAPPAVNLQLELRWVDSSLPAAATAGVRDGATVIGTAGSVSPRGAIVTSSAAPPTSPVQRFTVLNGQATSLQLDSREPLQWVPGSIDVDPYAATPASAVRRVRMHPVQDERRSAQSIHLTPSWPGGRAPVRVEFKVRQDGSELQSTVLVPMERWQTVARTGNATPAPAERGTVSSRDAEGQAGRELQLRIGVQP